MKYTLFKLTLYTLLLLLNLLLARGVAELWLPDVYIHPTTKYLWLISVYLLIFFYLRLFTRRMVTTSETWLIIKGSVIALIISFALMSILKQADHYSRLIILTFFSLNLLLPIWIYYLKRRSLQHPLLRERVLVICDEEACDNSQQWLSIDNPFGFDVAHTININHHSPEGLQTTVDRILEKERFFATIIMLESTGMERMFHLMDKIQHKVKRILLVPRMTSLPMFNAEVFNSINQKGLIFFVRNNLLSSSDRALKYVSDFTLALTLTLLLSPFLLGLYLWVWVVTEGKPVFRQERVGQNGQPFKIYKFRTMRADAAEELEKILASDPAAREEWERDRKLKDDPRITHVGHFLRRTSLDELPQLINVLRGQMSLVGPRPIITEEIPAYSEYIDYYQQVRPGITGLWQVSGRNELSYAERVQLDVWYVRNWSLELDLIILTKTFVAVLLRKGSY
ncbi:exopolysaccharide biosynthesis polyprenyl glycosylphosphotransferase [Thiothrix lacustris]|uniref:Exopolysaccharide biosynthesis polyprenyl glycosylphosphotransferase n=1 Tax=Thiothrix lacustris TaxID=525917 RepID=A0ABY9MMC9_9GAMM|nr:exopolysaccharide biosynthesis polyprenyl glycosylphosphotransferase [Thiothrix lacustris]WML89819.1 exopolysaccharide biosynthesis polyprenyl glycosylphosphotransferase [Thiothrix lacustris]WMP18582.1 exopolysaccharide biosynthesis polyprenyl glycosylphosphotransferase [Thiothrix lacustris]